MLNVNFVGGDNTLPKEYNQSNIIPGCACLGWRKLPAFRGRNLLTIRAILIYVESQILGSSEITKTYEVNLHGFCIRVYYY